MSCIDFTVDDFLLNTSAFVLATKMWRDANMTAYTIIDIDIVDAEAMRVYEEGIADLLPRFGASLLAREESAVTLDGSWSPRLLVIIAFADKDAILRFYESAEYAPLKAIRQGAAQSRVVAIAGFDPGAVA
jgi:uncharacterized protein (DUF1330 family)